MQNLAMFSAKDTPACCCLMFSSSQNSLSACLPIAWGMSPGSPPYHHAILPAGISTLPMVAYVKSQREDRNIAVKYFVFSPDSRPFTPTMDPESGELLFPLQK